MLRRTLAVAMVVSATPLQAAPMQPTAKWVVNFDEAQCLAQREYGTAKDPFTLILKQPALGSVVQVAVQTKGNFRGKPEQVDGAVQFGEQPSHDIPALQWRPDGSKLTLRMINLPLSSFAAARTATTIRFKAGMLQRELALSDVPDLLKVMDTCVADLRRAWNLSADGETAPQSLAASASSQTLSGLIKAEDYPGVAIREGQTGTVTMVVLIDEAGRVADCSIVETSGVAVLDSQSCAVVRERARFTPAVGANGRPAKQGFMQRITWRMK